MHEASIRTGTTIVSFVLAGFAALAPSPAGAVEVRTETELRKAWASPRVEVIDVAKDIVLRSCQRADPIRESPVPIRVVGHGHAIRQGCFENRLLRQDGTGFVQIEGLTLSRGGSDGPGAAVTTRGEIRIIDSKILKNLAEEPGGGVFSMRRAIVLGSVLTGNLANDDGGAVYARRGGILIKDSVLNGNLVDGSGGALGSTGDIKVVRSSADGNITDGDGGAIYTDEDGDVTVVESSVSGNTADGPGGAIFTLDGDVTIVGSVLNGNRADDRGGAISGESDVTVLRSTISRNVSEAHGAGGIWTRGDLYVSGSTVTENTAQGQGGGILGGGEVKLSYSSVLNNISPYVSNVAASSNLDTFGSVIGPPREQPFSDPVNCKAPYVTSHGFNVATDSSCGLGAASDRQGVDTKMGALLFNGGLGDTNEPLEGSIVIDNVPFRNCPFIPFGRSNEGEQHLADLGINPIAPTTTDQRGVTRPTGPHCDSGAIEKSTGVPLRSPGFAARPPVSELATEEVDERVTEAQTNLSARSSKTIPTPRDLKARPHVRNGPLRRTARQLNAISAELRKMERSDARYDSWRKCIREVPVSQFGDRNRNWGYIYNEVDGTGAGFQTALRVDRSGSSDYRFMHFSYRRGCRSDTTKPGGTADPASAPVESAPIPMASASSKARPHVLTPAAWLVRLENRVEALEARARVVERKAKMFDEWESCLSWLPVTEYGDPDRQFGLRWVRNGRNLDFGAAVTFDYSPWDDPDYTILAFRGRDRPGVRGCQGEGAPASSPVDDPEPVPEPRPFRLHALNPERVEDLQRDTADLWEDIEDLYDPNFEFASFDQCMYTVGMTQYGRSNGKRGFAWRDRKGKRSTRPALAMDMFGFDRPQYNFMAFSGEEPPQIECNEDASGHDTEE